MTTTETITMNGSEIKLYETGAVAEFDGMFAGVWIDEEDMPNLYVKLESGNEIKLYGTGAVAGFDGIFVEINDDNQYKFEIVENNHYLYLVDDFGDVAWIDMTPAGYLTTTAACFDTLREAIDYAKHNPLEYSDWYAVDSYDPTTNIMQRVCVAEIDVVSRLMEHAAEPTDLAMQPFYRCSVISTDDARKWFEYESQRPVIPYFLDEQSSSLSISEAAKVMGMSRQRVHTLYKQGRIAGGIVHGRIVLSRDSINEFLGSK